MIRTGLAISAAAAAAVLTLTGCSTAALAADDGSRPAASVSAASGTLQTDNASPARILIGWGQLFHDDELTTPNADQVQARCIGAGKDLRIKLTTPQGWTVYMTANSPKLHVTNDKQNLDGELDATPKIPGMPVPITWTDTTVDLAAAAHVPDNWNSRYGPGQQFYLAARIDCGAP